MTTVGKWNPNKVRQRVLSDTWVSATNAEAVDSGMVLITPSSLEYVGTSASIVGDGSIEFDQVTSISLRGIFSSRHSNYMIVSRFGSYSSSTTASLTGRLLTSTSEASGADYSRQFLYSAGIDTSALRSTSQTSMAFATSFGVRKAGFTLNIFGPYLPQHTIFKSLNALDYNNSYFNDWACTHSVNERYSGFRIIASEEVSGLVSVYGLVST